VRGTEGVVHVYVGIGGHRLRHCLAITSLLRGLLLVHARIAQHEHIASAQAVHDRVHLRAKARRSDLDRLPEELFEVGRHRRHHVLALHEFLLVEGLSVLLGLFLRLLRVLLGIAQVRHEDEILRALFEDILDRGKRRLDARVVLDHAVLHRHVKIDAHDDALALEIDIANGLLRNAHTASMKMW